MSSEEPTLGSLAEPEPTLAEKQFMSNSAELISNANHESIVGVVTIIKKCVPKFCTNYKLYNTDGVTNDTVYFKETEVIAAIDNCFEYYVKVLATTTQGMLFNIPKSSTGEQLGPSTGETLEQLTKNAWDRATSQLLPASSPSGTNTNINNSNSIAPRGAISSSSASSSIPKQNQKLINRAKNPRFYRGSRKPKKPSRKKV